MPYCLATYVEQSDREFGRASFAERREAVSSCMGEVDVEKGKEKRDKEDLVKQALFICSKSGRFCSCGACVGLNPLFCSRSRGAVPVMAQLQRWHSFSMAVQALDGGWQQSA